MWQLIIASNQHLLWIDGRTDGARRVGIFFIFLKNHIVLNIFDNISRKVT